MKKYNKVLLKLSGEALANDKPSPYDYEFLTDIAKELITLQNSGVKLSVVVGAGNFWRGRQGTNMDRTVADQMGMLATIMNALCLADAIKTNGGKAVVLSAIEVNKVCEYFTKQRAEEYLDKGYIVVLGGGTGSPYFSTDTATSLKAAELEVDLILLAKNVDGIYTADPMLDKTATRYDKISYMDFITNRLRAMDTTAITMCMENKIPVFCFKLGRGAILKAVNGEIEGTLISD